MNEIKCKLMQIPENAASDKLHKMKVGRYHGSNFWSVPEFGSKKWVVAVRISLDFSSLSEEEECADHLTQLCLNYLNRPPERKKYAKRQPKPIYGRMSLYSAKILKNKKGEKYINALLIVGCRKHPHFWGKGKLV